MVVDSHTHAWGPDVEAHPWTTTEMVEAVESLPVETVYTAEELLADMDAVGVDEAFVVGLPVCEWTDNWYVKQVAREYDRLYGIGLLDPFADDAAAAVRDLHAVDDVVGFRLAPVFPRDQMYRVDPTETFANDWLRDAIEETAFWEACREVDATVTLLVGHEQLGQVRELVETYPDLSYVVDHFARAPADIPLDDPDLARLTELADVGDVLAKASGLPALSNEPFPHRDMAERVQWLLDAFGREKVAWGSDYPFVSSVTDYESCLTCLDHFETLSAVDRRWLTERSFVRHVGAG